MFADAGEAKVRLCGVQIKGMNFQQECDAGLAQEALRLVVEDVVQKIANQADSFASIQPPVARAAIVGVNGSSFYIDNGENFSVGIGQRDQVHRVLGQSAICSVIDGEAAEGDSLRPTS